MGLIIPTASRGMEHDVMVQPSSSDPLTGGPDAYNLSTADFPKRELPKVDGNRDPRFQVVYRQSVLDDIHAHGKSSPEAEVCGVLIGDIYADRVATWSYIQHCIRGNEAIGKQTEVTITSETWTRIHETLERDFPGKKIVGWYHTHPGFGIFLSGMDLFIQDNFFNQPWQVAAVFDPHSGDEGTFVWRNGKSMRERILVENDVAGSASGDAEPSSKAVEELTRRVRALERRLDILLTGFLFLILIGLIAPLILAYVDPDALKLTKLRQVLQPAATTQPSEPAAEEKPSLAKPPASAVNNVIAPSPVNSAAARPAAVTTPPPTPRQPATLVKPTPDGEDTVGGPRILTPKSQPGR